LNKEGITDIEVQGMYVLDYEYHRKRSKFLLKEFNEKWTKQKRKKSPSFYKEERAYMDRNYKKQDLISEIKTERLIKNFERVLWHYPKATVKSYPGEVDNMFHISIPRIENKEDIKGKILQEIYELIEERYVEDDIER